MNTPALQLGTWLSLGDPTVAELAATCGWDWVLMDLEHGAASEAAIPDQLRALKGSRTEGIVRVGAPHHDLIARVLDWGARGVMVPHVETPESARMIVEAARYAPLGKRGFSRSVRAHAYGNAEPAVTPDPVVITQIESGKAVQRAAEIAAVEGVDILFVGPADLQYDLATDPHSAPGSYDHCLESVARAAALAGKKAGILLREPADLSRHRAMGFSHIALESDVSILRKAYRLLLSHSQ